MMLPIDLESPAGQAFIVRNFQNREVLTVPRTRALKAENCYANVQTVVDCEGGQAVWGWELRQLPGHYLEALHHSVWRSPSGRIEDLTAGTNSGFTLFVIDPVPPVSRREPRVPSKFHQVDEFRSTKAWIVGNVRRIELLGDRDRAWEMLHEKPWDADLQRKFDQLNRQFMTLTDTLRGYAQRFEAGDFEWEP